MSAYQVCTRCIYDNKIPVISFNADGLCSYCQSFEQLNEEYPTGAKGQAVLENMARQIREDGKGKPYDVVVGVSGGCDSSYLLYLAKELGLRPLAAHFDNTWNSKIAVENIRAVLEGLNVDLFTYVVDHREYNDIFKAFLLASVPDVDTPSDLGLATTHYMAAAKHKIRWIWEGHSFRTEGISPLGWFYMDAKYIQMVHKQFGALPMKTYPNLWLHRWMKWMLVNRIRKVRPLYYLDYDKEKTKQFLSDSYGWQWYGGHHMENRTSYFTNNYYLPRKFGIDLRLCEYSALVRSGQLGREEALERIQEPKPMDPKILTEVFKRLDLTEAAFEEIMSRPLKNYTNYTTYKRTFERMRPLFWMLYKMEMVPKSFYLKFAN